MVIAYYQYFLLCNLSYSGLITIIIHALEICPDEHLHIDSKTHYLVHPGKDPFYNSKNGFYQLLYMEKEIRINVTLDDKQVPEKIFWNADDLKDTEIPVRALLLALWDHNNKDTLRLDLWTKDMSRDEMKIFFYETLKTMADSLERSIDDERIAGDMRDFCAYFAEKMDIAEKPDSGKNQQK